MNPVKRVLALDVGEKRIGVAVSDELGLTAQGVETIQASGWSNDLSRVASLLERYHTDRVLVGLPRTMKGEIGPQAEKIMRFAEQLTLRGWQVRYQDERLTTSLAQRALIEGGVRREKRGGVVDKLAAVAILQSYLDGGGWVEETPRPRVTDVKVWKGGRIMAEIENSNMEPDEERVVELLDEDGNTIRFEHVATIQHEGNDYVLLAPLDPVDDMEEDEVLVLKIDNDENGDEIYVSVDDDDLVAKVFERYLKLVENDEE